LATEWWVPVLSFAGGSGVTLTVEYLRSLTARADRRQTAIERRDDRKSEQAARATDRRLHLEDEHRASQREALVELQDKLSDYIRTSGEAQHADQMAWQKAGKPDKYPVSQLPSLVDEMLNTLQRRVQILAARIDNEEVRQGVSELVLRVIDFLSVKESDRAYRLGGRAAADFGALNSRIGQELRSLTAQASRAGRSQPMSSGS
jgi:hypothetical protein